MSDYRYFTLNEFKCKHTGENKINPDFVAKLDDLRHECGFPFVINSGYRDKTHPHEASKPSPGYHSKGIAADIQCWDSEQKYLLVKTAIEHGFKGIGVARTFIHLDDRDEMMMWAY